MPVAGKKQPLAPRFWAKVDIRSVDECWPWQASFRSDGYGAFKMRDNGVSKVQGAHRVSFFLTHGHWPTVGRHRCDNRSCCNPDHIEDGTQQQNIVDCLFRGGRPVSDDHPWSKHSRATVAELRLKYETGSYSHRTLAEETGIPKSTVQHIVSGKARKYEEVYYA